MQNFIFIRIYLGNCVCSKSGSHNSRSIWSCGISLRSPLISSKLCLFFILGTWMFSITMILLSFFMVEPVKLPEKRECWLMWSEVSGHSLLRNYFLTLSVVFISVPFTLFIILYFVIFLKLKSQKAPGEQTVNACFNFTCYHPPRATPGTSPALRARGWGNV